MQDDRADAIRLTAEEMNVNITCPHVVLVQAHIATTISALPDELLVIKSKGLAKILRSDKQAKYVSHRPFLTKFMKDVGHVT